MPEVTEAQICPVPHMVFSQDSLFSVGSQTNHYLYVEFVYDALMELPALIDEIA